MLNLPKSTEMSKQLPKKAIYEKFNLNTAAKDRFDADISKITIVNEISPNTVNIQKGAEISAFYVLLVILKRRDYDTKNIATLSKLIPQNMLFLLQFEDKCQLAVYRTRLICGEWERLSDCEIKLSGLNLDKVWENVVVQVGGIIVEGDNSLDEQIVLNEERKRILKEIERLDKKARAEVQPRKKVELVQKIKKLKEKIYYEE